MKIVEIQGLAVQGLAVRTCNADEAARDRAHWPAVDRLRCQNRAQACAAQSGWLAASHKSMQIGFFVLRL